MSGSYTPRVTTVTMDPGGVENNTNDFYESLPDSRRGFFGELYDRGTVWC